MGNNIWWCWQGAVWGRGWVRPQWGVRGTPPSWHCPVIPPHQQPPWPAIHTASVYVYIRAANDTQPCFTPLAHFYLPQWTQGSTLITPATWAMILRPAAGGWAGCPTVCVCLRVSVQSSASRPRLFLICFNEEEQLHNSALIIPGSLQ